MLRKLLKYEVRATARIFVPLYALLIVFALINKAFIAINSDTLQIPGIIAFSIFVIIIVAICVMTLVVTIQRFYKNLLSDEGYLMFTLPVKAHSHITSKLLISMLWSFLSLFVSGFAVLLAVADPENMKQASQFMSQCADWLNKVGFPAYMTVAEAIVAMIISSAASIIMIYAAMAVGNLSGKHRILLSLGAYIGLTTVLQIVGSIFIVTVPKNWFYFENVSQNNYMPLVNSIQLMLLFAIIFSVIFGVAFYVLTNLLLKKKLNLE